MRQDGADQRGRAEQRHVEQRPQLGVGGFLGGPDVTTSCAATTTSPAATAASVIVRPKPLFAPVTSHTLLISGAPVLDCLLVMDVHGRDLRYFVAVADELHFTRAAQRLFVSQPALSKQIRMLERQLGAPLFERDHRDVRLAPVGAALLPYAQRMPAEWDAAWAAAEQAKAAQRATPVVGMSTSPGRGGMLPAIRSRFSAEHPDVTLTLRQISWVGSTAGLADGSTDVAFVRSVACRRAGSPLPGALRTFGRWCSPVPRPAVGR